MADISNAVQRIIHILKDFTEPQATEILAKTAQRVAAMNTTRPTDPDKPTTDTP